MANTSSGRGRDERAGRGGAAKRNGGAPNRTARAAKRGAQKRDKPAIALLGPDDERPYPKAGSRTRRPLGDRAQSGVRARGTPTRGGRKESKNGEVTGPFKRRRAEAEPVKEERRPVLRLAEKRAPRDDRGEKRAPGARGKAPTARTAAPGKSKGRPPAAAGKGQSSAARRRRRPTEATEELRRFAGGNANRATETLERATEAFARGRERDALRILRPLIDAYPKAAAVRELAGLCRYRIGSYAMAADDLAAFADLTGSTEQHPVLMDCRRAQGRLRDVEALWEELRETSPTAALVTEGRIVLAGALADAGRLADAIDLLERRAQSSGRLHEHIVRLWYALADLQERAGDVPRARALFEQVRTFDSGYADVAERLAALS